jgi:tRNA pseudouridine38-40 synthase
VAAEVVKALEIVLRQPVKLTVAGRTDTGVHALGQVVSYPGPSPRLRSVNALLPDEISVYAAETVPDDFSARHDAVARSYVYRVHTRSAPDPFERGRALWWP